MRPAACLAVVVSCVALLTGVAHADSVPGGFAGNEASLAESPLVVPQAETLTGGSGLQEAREVQLASPAAVTAREESRLAYSGLSDAVAASVAQKAFPSVMETAGGGPPVLPAGQSVVGFPTDDAAQIDLGEGRHGLVESLFPMAVETQKGQRVPVDLRLLEAGGGFEPKMPVVPLRVPRRLSQGVSLSDEGVSLTPVDAHGVPLAGGEGVAAGTDVFYANTQTDTDTAVKPVTFGFTTNTFLRSVNSPRQLYFKVGLPAGARLEGEQGGEVQVVDEGTVLTTIFAPEAQDAAGSSVPVSMTVSGDLIALNVEAEVSSTGYQYPIDVDPTVIDETSASSSMKEHKLEYSWWTFYTPYPSEFKYNYLEGEISASSRTAAHWSELYYVTQGKSQIYRVNTETAEKLGSANVQTTLRIQSEKGIEGTGGKAVVVKFTTNPGWTDICTHTSCVEGKDEINHMTNGAYFEQEALNTGSEKFDDVFYDAQVYIIQEEGPKVSFDTKDEKSGKLQNPLYGPRWVNSTEVEKWAVIAEASDPGIGLHKEKWYSPQAPNWGFTSTESTNFGNCKGVQCEKSLVWPVEVESEHSGHGTEHLPDGEDTVEVTVEDGVGLSEKASAKVKVDNTPPHSIALSGLPSNHELADSQHITLKGSATDGVTGTPSSGVGSLLLEVDGQPVSGPSGYCSPGPCTASAEWTLSAEKYAAGEHLLTVIATDNVGNVSSEEFHLTIHHPEGVPVGAGAVNPVTGELSVGATDVSLAAPGGGLTVSRSYRSRHLAQGAEGPLGPQWNLSLGAQQSLTRVSGGMLLTDNTGAQAVFPSKGSGEFNSPTGDTGLTLSEKTVEGKAVFTLSTNGEVTTFELPSGSSGSVWMPSSVAGPNGTNTILYKFKLASGVIEPTEELAPVPANVSCGKEISELKEGCRALKFEYAKETKAKGEKASEWGSFNGRLAEVKYIAWNSSKAKVETTVAEYAYDIQGRLRAAWDPRVTPNLKATYGYNTEGLLTAISTPGKEPELFEYGTTPTDGSSGRLLAVSVPSAQTPLGSGELPAISEGQVPTLSSTTPKVGVKISVNLNSEKMPGKWTGAPLAFIYQWDDCNSSGKECTPIPGAVNQAYYPVPGDEGRTLVAEAVALNAAGATAAASVASSAVASGTPNNPSPEPPVVGSNSVTTLEYQVPLSGSGSPHEMSGTEVGTWGQTDVPSEAMAVFPPDTVMGWPAKEYRRETVYYIDGKDRTVNVANSSGGISTSEYNKYNDVTRTLSPDNRLKALEETGKTVEASKLLDTENSYEESGSEPGTELVSTLGPQHTVKLAVGKEGKRNEETLARDHIHYYYNEGHPAEGGPYHLVTKTVDGAETTSKEEFDQRTTEMSYSGQSNLGWKLRKPTSVTTDPSGLKLVHVTEYDPLTGNVTSTKMPAASGKDAAVPPAYKTSFGSKGAGTSQFNSPNSATTDASHDIWVTDYTNNRVEELTGAGAFIRVIGFGVTNGESKFEICTSSCKAGIAGAGEGQFSGPEGIAFQAGDIYVVDHGNNRVEEFNENGEYIVQFGAKGTGAGQMSGPGSIAINSGGNAWIGDIGNNRVDEFTTAGKFTEAIGYGVTNGEAKFEICTTSCRAGTAGSGNGQFSSVQGDAISGTNLYVADLSNNRIEEFNEKGEYVTKFGTKGKGNGEFEFPTGVAANPTTGNIYVTDWSNGRVQEFSATGSYVTQFGTKGTGKGQLSGPEGITINASQDVYVVDSGNNRVEEWVPTITGNENARNTKIVYYGKEANSEYPACGGHPELANLQCQTTLAAQPGTSGLPELPTTKYTYNVWNEPETITETVGTTTRTKTNTYDNAGRLKTTGVSSTVGTALSATTYEYNINSGAPEKQCSNSGKSCTEGSPKTITTVNNRLGEIESYTDADENKASYEYDEDGRPTKINDGKGTQTYTYSTTTGLPTEVLDSSHEGMKFTGTYDAEGHLLTEGYPNGMTATYTYNTIGKPVKLEYQKTTHCVEEAEKCKWFKDLVVPSIHGQWIEQTSTLSHQTYTYDSAGRLTEVQNTPAGKGCTTRTYAYDEDTNRISLTTREPGSEGKCATEGGTTAYHTYDTADRLTEPGITYNTFGDITALPPQGSEDPELTSSYYVDDQLASQKQNKQTIGYELDPAGRTRETVSTGEPNNSDIISHYVAPNSTPTWTTNPTSGEWSRNIAGIDGTLAAIQSNSETPELQLTNLHGDIIAKAYLSETATELAAKADTSEFGVPTVNAPAKYAWLGAIELPTELPSGAITMGARSYVPQLGRFLQPDPLSGGSANAYNYTFGDPVNSTDPTGAFTDGLPPAYSIRQSSNQASQAAALRAAEEAAARAAAEKAAAEAAEAAALAGPQYEEEEGFWEEWEEESWWEDEGSLDVVAEGSKQATQNAVFGPGVGDDENNGEVVRLCPDKAATITHNGEGCAVNALSIGEAWGWVKHHAARIVRTGVKVALATGAFAGASVAGVVAVFGTAACLEATEGLEAWHCLHIALGAGSVSAGGFVAGAGVFSSALHEWL